MRLESMFRTVLHVTIPTRVQGPQRPLRPEADAARKRTSSPRVSSRTCAGESCRARVTTGRSPPGRAVLIRPRIHPCFVRRAEEGHDPPRRLPPPPTHQHRPRMYMSVEPTVPRGLAMAEARPVGRQNAVVAVTRRSSGSVRINVAEAESRILGGVAHRTHAPRCNTVCVRGLQQPLCAYG